MILILLAGSSGQSILIALHQFYHLKDVCIMAFVRLHDLSRRIFQSAAI